MLKHRSLLTLAVLAVGIAMATVHTFPVEWPMYAAGIAATGLFMVLSAPAFEFVAHHVKTALAMARQFPAGRSPTVMLIAAKAHAERLFTRKDITITGSWRMCPSV